MKAFRFRLESLLHLRNLTRERCLKEYAYAISERRREEERCEELADRLAKIEISVATRREEGISGHDQDIFLASIDHAKEALGKQREATRQALAEEERKRISYLKSDMDEKTLLRLKERRKEEHQRDQETKEERALEDMIGVRYSLISPTEISYETA
tara:strand:- start:72 stop:542 length:471 start_codon:yes stop_codon:yes gene_type:complete